MAGAATFLALAYIVVVNPAILAEAGIDPGAAFFATVLTAGLATLLMGVWARLPFALAPGMEMNAYVAFVVVGGLGFSWQQALGGVFWSGVVFIIVSVSGLREKILRSIPDRMKISLALSVGVFIALVALKLTGLLRFDGLRLLGVGDFRTVNASALFLGLSIILILNRWKFTGSVLISIVATAALLHAIGIPDGPDTEAPEWRDLWATLGKADLSVIMEPRMWSVILVLFLLDFYGSVAKLIGLTAGTSLDTSQGLPRLKQALIVDSGATVAGAVLGTSNMTVYVESGVGIASGGRTGLSAVICASGLLGCLVLAPIVRGIPVVATSGALLFVAMCLCPTVRDIRRMDVAEAFALGAMQLAVVLSFAIDRAFLIGALFYVCRSVLRREVPNPYLLGSAAVLTIGLLAE